MAQELGVGIMGTGRVSRDHAFAIDRAPGLRLIGAADPQEDLVRAFGERYACAAFTDPALLLERAVIEYINASLGRPAGAPVARSAIEQTAGIAAEVAAFSDAVATAAPLPVSGDHAIAVVETMLAVEESARSGREVRLRR